MVKDKRILRRPWGRRLKGGWVIQPTEVLAALKDGDIAEIGKLHVGAKQLSDLIRLMRFPDEEFLITSNGHLEVQTMKRVLVLKDGHNTTKFRKPRLHHSFRVGDKAWLPTVKRPLTTLVIKPRKY